MSLRAMKVVAWAGVFMPLLAEIYILFLGDPGPDPAKQAVHFIGQAAVWLLLAALSASPLRTLFGWQWPLRIRRLLGVAAFCYGVLHLIAYIWFLLGFEFDALAGEFVERPYITAGMFSLLLMLPLALTSSDAMVRRLTRNWKRLHMLVYPAAIAAVIHVWWQARSDIGLALTLALVLGVGFVLRHQRVRKVVVGVRQGVESPPEKA